jgi:hypothetical protein
MGKSAAKVRPLQICTLRNVPELPGRSDPEHWTFLFSQDQVSAWF